MDKLADQVVPLISLDSVFHIGTMDSRDIHESRKSSLEGFCLSVSLEPEVWRSIAHCGNADALQLTRPGSLWLDVLSLGDTQWTSIAAWGVQEGLVEPATLWRAWSYDSEAECMQYMICDTRTAAEAEIDDNDDDYVDPFETHRLTDAGMAALERWDDAKLGLDGLIILWADRVLAPQNEMVAGLWWNEDFDPENLSCPRGGILRSRIAGFDVSGRDGKPVKRSSDDQMLPDDTGPSV